MDISIDVSILIITVASAFVFGACLGILIQDSSWKKESVKKGHAQYNKQTGKWKWNE